MFGRVVQLPDNCVELGDIVKNCDMVQTSSGSGNRRSASNLTGEEGLPREAEKAKEEKRARSSYTDKLSRSMPIQLQAQ